jgi:rfaE bifunctional protein nucleotidyltransferase chain/domain
MWETTRRFFQLFLKTQPSLDAFAEKKTILPEKIASLVTDLKSKGLKIATLNGSFDLLHAGHLHIIFEAKKRGDVLIVALNSDDSIRAYKSKERPIIPLEYRLKMMASLHFVDYVTFFEETDPINLLEKIKPDVHVNGAEYGQNCLEAETVKKFGGEIYIVDLIPSLSTSQIVKKIQGLPR